MMIAAKHGNVDIVQLLAEKGASIEVQDEVFKSSSKLTLIFRILISETIMIDWANSFNDSHRKRSGGSS